MLSVRLYALGTKEMQEHDLVSCSKSARLPPARRIKRYSQNKYIIENIT